MKKKILCLILCLALLLPMLSLDVQAKEHTFYRFWIDAGQGPMEERAIVSDGELYIPAENFGKYTYFQYHSDTNTFLIDGQEANRAFKKVIINPDTKKVGVINRIFDLKDCFVVDGVVYLPFCQMMPILNGQILTAQGDTIYVANPKVTLANLLYDFHLNDYSFNLYDEFYGDMESGIEEGFFKKIMSKGGLLAAYVLPSYLFNSVVDFRLDRLDFIADSGTFEDYHDIFSDYLRDENLFLKANEMHDDPALILGLINFGSKKTKILKDTIGWVEALEEVDLEENAHLFRGVARELVEQLQDVEDLPDYSYDAGDLIKTWHDDSKGISFADFFELFEYVYVYFTHVEDNHKMLDAVYNINSGGNYKDVQFRAAMAVYDLYGEEVAPALTDRVAKEVLKEVWKESTVGGKLKLYQLTAKISGAVWEKVIPGSTKDVSVLTLHAGVADSARMSAAAYNLNTEEEVEDYRLSLLLMMMASRECYKIMADVAEGYGHSAGEYKAKVEKLEAKIMGLYLAAENLQYEALDNLAPMAEENRKMLKDADFFDAIEPLKQSEPAATEPPTEQAGSEVDAFMEFLAQNPVYRYYALLDIDQDGCMELIAKEAMNSGSHDVDLYIYHNGQIWLGYEDIWGTDDHLYYNPNNRWLESLSFDGNAGGVWFYCLDVNGNVIEKSFAEYSYSGKWYNGSLVQNEQMLNAWNALVDQYDPSTSVMVEILPTGTEPEDKVEVPTSTEPEDKFEEPTGTEPEVEVEVPTGTEPEEEFEMTAGALHYYFLAQHPEYNYYALLDINQDGTEELLTCETTVNPEQMVDIWVNRGGIYVLAYEDIWVKVGPLTYNRQQRWVENKLSGTGGGGVAFFYMNESGDIIWESFEHYEWCGGLYNGESADIWEEYMAYERLEEAYNPDISEEILFLPRSF